MQITIDVNSPLTAMDRKILESVLGQAGAAEWPPAPVPEPSQAQDEPQPAEQVFDELMAQAVALASDMAENGQKGPIKKALVQAGARRVTEITEIETLKKFIQALQEG